MLNSYGLLSGCLTKIIGQESSPLPLRARPDWHADRRRHAQSRCLAHDPAPRRRAGPEGQDRLPHLPSRRDHGVSEAGGTLKNAQALAAQESPRTTKLYDRMGDEITLDEVERITI
jgi:hypothetical protein